MMKIERSIFVLLFWLMILIPAPLVLFGWTGNTALEARSLMPYPTPSWDTAWRQETFQGISAAFEDRMPLRNRLVGFRSSLARQGLIPNPFHKVVFGNDDWLFVATSFDPHCPEDERSQIVSRLSVVADLLESRGIRFVLSLVPNKASIHHAHLPDWILAEHDVAQERTTSMRAELASQGDWFMDITPAMEARLLDPERTPLYYPTDTHWTWNGAEVFVEALVETLQPGLYDPDEVTLLKTVKANLDLDRLSGSSVERDLLYYSAKRPGTTDMVLDNQARSLPAVVTRKQGEPGRLIEGTTLIVRDSFWDHAGSVGHEYFEHLISVHANDARQITLLAEAVARADTVIFETGERKFCEVMLATIANERFPEVLVQALDSDND